MTKVIFQHFPDPGILKKQNPGLSRGRGNLDFSGNENHVKFGHFVNFSYIFVLAP